MNTDNAPKGMLTLRVPAMPKDANAAFDIFGGWVMAQMDSASGIRAAERAKGRVVTAAVREMSFAKPVKIGDALCVYTEITRVGRSSITLRGGSLGTALPDPADGSRDPWRIRHGFSG
jgi:acyl-CoA thioesterase YciA